MNQEACMPRLPWGLSFMAEPEEVAALRRTIRSHLHDWGLQGVTDEAELCLSELVSNVVTHVGVGTPAMLAVSMSGTRLRIEVHDPDTRALPILNVAGSDDETGRGMALVGALADRWGIQLSADRKVTWCELPTGLPPVHEGCGSVPVAQRDGALWRLYGPVHLPCATAPSEPDTVVAEERVIDAITDILRRLRIHGGSADKVLDQARNILKAEVAGPPAT